MIFWVDAQLPPTFAPWLTEEFTVMARLLKWLGLRDAEDEVIFQMAKQTGENIIIISKDSDFVELILRFDPPPQLLWVTCGNLTNQHLKFLFKQLFPEALKLLSSGVAIVEIGSKT